MAGEEESDDNWSDVDGAELLGGPPTQTSGAGARANDSMLKTNLSSSSIGSDALGVLPDAFQSSQSATAAAPQAARSSGFEELRTQSGDDELAKLAQEAQQLGFNPFANASQPFASNPFDAPVPAPGPAAASVPAAVPGGMYRCARDAGATVEFEPDPATATITRMYRQGEALYVSEIRTTAAGQQRALTVDGAWVSLKSASGLTLLEPVDGDLQFDLQSPASPGDSNPFSAGLSGDQASNPFSVDPDPDTALLSTSTAPAPAPAPAAPAAPVDVAPAEAEKQKSKKKRLAQAVHNFTAESDGDLALAVGDIVVVTKGKEGETWWKGHIQGNKKAKGVFPATFVQVLEPQPEPEPEPEPTLPPQSGARCTVLDLHCQS